MRGGTKPEQWSHATPSSSCKYACNPNIELEARLPFTPSTYVIEGGFSRSAPQPDSRILFPEYSIFNHTKIGSCKNLMKYEVGVSKNEFPLTLSQALPPRSQLLRHPHHHRSSPKCEDEKYCEEIICIRLSGRLSIAAEFSSLNPGPSCSKHG